MPESVPPTGPGRRAVLRAAAAAGALGLLGTGQAVAAPSASAAARVPLPRSRQVRRREQARAATAVPTSDAFLLHLLRRATYGATPELLAEARAAGAQAWLDRQLDPARIDDSACDRICERFPLARATPQQIWHQLPVGGWAAMDDVTRATLARAFWSQRQLFEVMADFWSNHLNSTCPSSEVWFGKGWDDEHVIRKHALGRFSDMLVASCTSPAMLHYLDNANSRGKAPNENYGREVLELHTVGRDAGYGQAGVVDASRAFTGLSTWSKWNGGTPGPDGNYGTFRYRADWRYVGPLKVLGWTHPNSDKNAGPDVARSLMRYLASHPQTARRIARKLAVRFVSDDPPGALVDRLAKTYLDNDTAIAPVLRALFASPEFAASVGQKYRRPFEDLAATVRALGVQPSPDPTKTKVLGDLGWELGEAGHRPLAWGPPDGYPDTAQAWAGSGTLLKRWNLHLGIAQAWWKDSGFVYPGELWPRLMGQARPADRAALVAAVASRLMPGLVLPAAHRDALVAFLGGPGPVKTADTTWQFPVLVALLLDSPHWSTR